MKTPDIEHNRNDYELFVRDVDDKTVSLGKPLLSGNISELTWLSDDRRIAMLFGDDNGDTNTLVLFDVSTGHKEVIDPVASTIDSYSIDSLGTTVAYAVQDKQNIDSHVAGTSEDDIARGYLVSSGSSVSETTVTRSIYISHRNTSGEWSVPLSVNIENPFSHLKSTRLPLARSLSLSPNGKRLLLNYLSDRFPAEWNDDLSMKPFAALPQHDIMVLYDLDKASTALALNSPFPASTPLWSNDSQSFLVNSPSPVGSRWKAEDVKEHHASVADANLFSVNAASGTVEEVYRHVPFHHERPLVWRPDGDIIIQTGFAKFARLHRFGNAWHEAEHITLPQPDNDQYAFIVSDGTELIGTHETATTSPELFRYQSSLKQLAILTDINPQLHRAQFASAEAVHWVTTGGLSVNGLLFLPPNYKQGLRYPLVIQTKGDGAGWFVCDSGSNHDPSFAPQPLATAGIMYLVRTVADDWKFQDDLDNRNVGNYPGGIGEAVQQMDIWDSAVNMLDKRGMIDPSKVGIIGFSRTGWQVEFDLVHARVLYAAATVADNIQYSLSDYWLAPWFATDIEHMYGGSPEGGALENWLKYSPSFNYAKIRTPLLIEVMGYGFHEELPYKSPEKVPGNLIHYYELRESLFRLSKPFELYYYPDEQHQPDHPKARIASLQRNVDWYRFWLQGYEDDDQRKNDQYRRWRALKAQRDRGQNSVDNKVSVRN
ncbi:S9 family peptidase [Granulicella sp. L60]|uniref:alpha/beta hydrolase family protein n=1 Tax=Granulicella sp. L60 TaxID=1641866 RepID=UPI00131AB57A|nr:prolyl oligopeptidase family serine peptidase [Granulicella sp. L60]